MEKIVKVGDWLKDCDPRYSGRKVMVHTVYQKDPNDADSWYAQYNNGRCTFNIRLDRIHTSDYTGRKGWKLTTAEVS